MRASKEGTNGSNRQFRTRAGHLQSRHGHRILSVSGDGPARWKCVKLTTARTLIDQRVVEGRFHSVGDNCEGIPC